MQLKSVDGKLTLGSAYKLFVISWIFGCHILFGAFAAIFTLIALASEQATINGVIVEGTGPILTAMIPVLLLFPVVIIIQSFIAGGMLVLGLAVYRLWRPIKITDQKERVLAPLSPPRPR